MVSHLHVSDQVSYSVLTGDLAWTLWLRATRYGTFLIRADAGEGGNAWLQQAHLYQPCTASKRVSSLLYRLGFFHSSHFSLLWCLSSFSSCLNLTPVGPLMSSTRAWPRVKRGSVRQVRAEPQSQRPYCRWVTLHPWLPSCWLCPDQLMQWVGETSA